MQQFKEDSVAWETNPAYGWCNKNKKADGEFYNLYTDGLKIYTTIDSRMQKYAEDASVSISEVIFNLHFLKRREEKVMLRSPVIYVKARLIRSLCMLCTRQIGTVP